MKTIFKTIVIISAICLTSINVTSQCKAETKEFQCTQIVMSDCNTQIYLPDITTGIVEGRVIGKLQKNSAGKLEIFTSAEDEREINGSYHETLKRHVVSSAGRKTTLNYRYKSDTAYGLPVYCKTEEGKKSLLAISVNYKKAKIRIETVSKNGKVLQTITDNNKSFTNDGYAVIYDTWEKHNNLYYIYRKTSCDYNKLFIRTVNKKSLKGKTHTIKDKSFKRMKRHISSVKGEEEFKYHNGKIYALTKDSIKIYSVKGKKTGEYKLPDGGISFYDEKTDDPDNGVLVYYDFSINGDYIYYVNTSGIYRCNIKKDNGFELYYNASNDKNFNKTKGISDICFIDENTFYILYDAGHPVMYLMEYKAL